MLISTLRRFSGLVTLSAMSLLVGCSSFNKEYNAAPNRGMRPDDVTGRWSGYWKSDANGHTGDLKCVITKNPDATYRANFAATYWSILHFNYVATLKATPQGDSIHLTGEQDLGAMAGGVYNYDGTASDTHFDCKYSSKYDHGVFVMSRPKDAKQ